MCRLCVLFFALSGRLESLSSFLTFHTVHTQNPIYLSICVPVYVTIQHYWICNEFAEHKCIESYVCFCPTNSLYLNCTISSLHCWRIDPKWAVFEKNKNFEPIQAEHIFGSDCSSHKKGNSGQFLWQA